MYDIKSMNIAELSDLMAELSEPTFRAAQVRKWVAAGAESIDEMTNLPRALRDKLSQRCILYTPAVVRRQTSADGTVKLLWRLRDGETVESVVMSYRHGNTVCISTQVGCAQGCAFCASTRGGLKRNLEPSEMLDEVTLSAKASGLPITGVVLMGIGEPLENLDNVLRFLELLSDPDGPHIGMRHVSISTCGTEGGIERLAKQKLQVTLSVSLHAPDDETRSILMPVNRRSGGVKELIGRCESYRRATGRRVSYEYLLADGINDSDEQAHALAALIGASDAHVNLIPLNRVDGSRFIPSRRVRQFQDILLSHGVNVTVRRRMGADIDAACGQLRRAEAARTERK